MKRLLAWLKQLQAAFAISTPRSAAPVVLGKGIPTVGGGRDWRPQAVLRPVNPLFIWFSLALALLLNLGPWDRDSIAPDFLAVVLVFWNVREPRRVGMGAAFLFGLLMDVHDGALFGQHALAYTLLSYGAISLHRRILWFPLGAQMLYVLPLLLAAQIASLVIRLWVGGAFPGWLYFVESFVGAAFWPIVTWLLLAPQLRAVDRDETRPL
jgi:rod shape-determining protein MreD